jgi:CBS domain-containing protein
LLDDKIVGFKLAPPVCVASGSSLRQLIETVQRHRIGAVLVCDEKRPVGIMTERDVLMKVVARDVSYDEAVDKFMTPAPRSLTPDQTLGEVIALMSNEGFRNIPIVDGRTGEALALFRVQDVIDYLAESFPEHVLNLPPKSDQTMETPEGA